MPIKQNYMLIFVGVRILRACARELQSRAVDKPYRTYSGQNPLRTAADHHLRPTAVVHVWPDDWSPSGP
jgi:hypothetical protein